MKKLLMSLLVTISVLSANEEGGNYFIDNFLKYSTFYTSVSLNAPFEVKLKNASVLTLKSRYFHSHPHK